MATPMSLEQTVTGLIHETFRQRTVVVILFILINATAVAVGLAWPKSYTSSSTIIVEEKSIIQPLMHGAAVATDARDRARLAKEAIFGRKFMEAVLEQANWIDAPLDEIGKDKLSESIKSRTRVLNVGPNLIRIEFTDGKPERAFKTTQTYVDLFVNQSLGTQSQESQEAFDFIDRQVKEYHAKLIAAEHALKEFRSQNIDARPGTGPEIAGRIQGLQAIIEKTSLELKEAQIKKSSIEKQLSGEAEVTVSLTRESQYLVQIVELQKKLDTLRLSYHDGYPDIVRLKSQIEDLKEVMANERRRREQRRAPQGQASGAALQLDEGVQVNPLYQQLRQQLYETKTTIDTLTSRLEEHKQLLRAELQRGRRVHGGEAVLAELTRDYEVNRDIYQDLLRRRENARVSRNLDNERQGLTLRIYEPAFLPLQPSGVRFMHFAFVGVLLGFIGPPGLISALQQVSPRIRSHLVITDKLNLPLLTSVPQLTTPDENRSLVRSLAWHGFMILITLGFVGAAGLLRLTGMA